LNNSLERTIEESIKIESNVSDLYGLFYRIFEEDKDFWWQLKIEEKNHSFLLEGAKKALLEYNKFPQELISDSLESLIEANNNLRKMIDDFPSNPPSREIAFNTALEVEISAGEIHYQEAMKQHEGSDILKILQKINGDDKEHEQRIREYMKREGIKIFESY